MRGGARVAAGCADVKEVGAAHDLIESAFVYSPTGRTPGADVEIAGLDRRTEQNPSKVLNAFRRQPTVRAGAAAARRPLKELDPTFAAYQRGRAAELTAADVETAIERRQHVLVDGLATETYRRVRVSEALAHLGAPAPALMRT